MKQHIQFLGILFLALILISPTPVEAQGKPKKTETVTFFVNGDCDMCADRIEAACDLKGVVAAEYTLASYSLTLTYKPSKISLEQIHDAIAAAGYDTSERKATQESYDALPGCCQYDRGRTPEKK